MKKPSLDIMQNQLEDAEALFAEVGKLVSKAGMLSVEVSTEAEYNKVCALQRKVLSLQADMTALHKKITDQMMRWAEAHGVDAWQK